MKPSESPEDQSTLEMVAFRVAEQDFCFDIMSVREIRGWTETTTLPHADSFVKGVINLRGAVVPVIDLSDRLGLGRTDPCDRHVIIVAVVDGQTIGLLANMVSDILSVDDDAVHPVPEMVSGKVRGFVSGVVLLEERMLRRLDLNSVVERSNPVAA